MHDTSSNGIMRFCLNVAIVKRLFSWKLKEMELALRDKYVDRDRVSLR